MGLLIHYPSFPLPSTIEVNNIRHNLMHCFTYHADVITPLRFSAMFSLETGVRWRLCCALRSMIEYMSWTAYTNS